MKYIYIMFSLLTTSFIYPQKIKKIQAYINPYVSEIGNLNNKRNIVNTNRITVENIKPTTQEVGIQYITKNKKIYFGGGAAFKQRKYHYLLTYELGIPILEEESKTNRNRNIGINLIGIRGIVGIDVLPSTSVKFILEYNFISSISSNVENTNNFSFYYSEYYQGGTLTNSMEIKIREHEKGLRQSYNYVVPELNFQTKITKNISLNYGAKLKIWSIYDLYAVNIYGNYNSPNENTSLYSTTISSKYIAAYFGLIYSFTLQKKEIKKNQ